MKLFPFLLLLLLLLAAAAHASVLKFESELNEIYPDPNAIMVTSDFKFTNTSSESVKIREMDSGCSCLSVGVSGGKFTYAPGESGILRTTFEVGSFQGAVDKTVYLWLEGDPKEKPSSTIKLRIHIPVIIALEPKSLKWEVGSKVETKTIAVKMNYEKPIHIKSVSTSDPNFSLELVTVEEGKTYEIKITPKNTETSGLAIIRIETDADVKKQRAQQAFAGIYRPALANP